MTPWVTRLVVANVVVFFATRAAPQLAYPFVFVPGAVLAQPWTLVTYQFLHGDFFHLLGNMFGLFFLGPRVEARLGGRQFLALYFTGGITGALLSIPLAPGAAIIGASGSVFAVMLAFARYWPQERLLLWGVLPIESRVFVVLLTALSLWSGFTGAQRGIAHFAHLGGFLGGWLYLVWMERRSPARAFRNAALGPALRAAPKSGDLVRWERIPRERLHEVNRAEVDRVMEKARADGPASLTVEERAFLDRLVP